MQKIYDNRTLKAAYYNHLTASLTWVSRYQKGKTNLNFTGARDSEWQWHQLGVCTSLQTDNHASTQPLCFLQAGCPSCRPTNSIKALKALKAAYNVYNCLLALVLLLPHPFNDFFSRTTWEWESRHQKGKTSLDLYEAREDEVLGWQWHQLDHMQTICTSLHTNASSLNFLQAGCSSRRPTNSVKALLLFLNEIQINQSLCNDRCYYNTPLLHCALSSPCCYIAVITPAMMSAMHPY